MLRTTELDQFRYTFKNVVISLQGDSVPVTISGEMVKSITILKNYRVHIYPYMAITLQVARDDYARMQKGLEGSRITLNVNKFKLDEFKMRQPLLNTSLKVIDQDDLDMDIVKDLMGDDKDLSNDQLSDGIIEMRLFAYDDSGITKYRKMSSLNAITNTTTAIQHFFSSRGFDNILLSPVPGDSPKQIIIPYKNLIQSVNELNEKVGIYDYPHLFFMDFDRNYFIDIKNPVVGPKEYSKVIMYLEEPDSPESTVEGSFVDDLEKLYVLNLTIKPSILDMSNLIHYTTYDKSTVVVPGSPSVSVLGSGSNETASMVYNTKTQKQEDYKIRESAFSFMVNFSNVDISLFTPNKTYKLLAHKSYDSIFPISGEYKLAKLTQTLIKEGDRMRSEVNAVFNRIPK